MEVGKDMYSILKRNNIIVWLVMLLSIIVIISSFFFSFYIHKESQENIFAITDKGVLVPLKKLDNKRDEIKRVKANLDYLVSLYYDLDGYTMKEKKEKLFWLLGKQPTEVVKDRDKKGYFNTFLSISGLKQHASINQDSWKVLSIDPPYKIAFSVSIVRINGDSKTYYNSQVLCTLKKVNINYPYNPYGLLITNLAENLSKVDKDIIRKSRDNNSKETNQND